MSAPTVGQIVALLEKNRFSNTVEKVTQQQIEQVLSAAGINFERECHLSEEDIPDFFIEGGIVLEVKLRARRVETFKQLERYAAHEPVRAVILFTATATGLPTEIKGKPARVASLGKGWL